MIGQSGEFYSTHIANGVFNALLCFTAIILNSITIHAVRRTPSLAKPLKTLLLSLAVSDLCVGLIVHPLHVTLSLLFLKDHEQKNWTLHEQNLTIALAGIGNFLFYASFFSLLALTVDRFLAILFHLRYQVIVTHNRAIVVVISLFVISAFLSSVGFSFTPKQITTTLKIQVISEILCIIIIAILYCKIYLTVRRHRNEIRALHVLPLAGENGKKTANAARRFKSVGSTFFVYLVFLACYLPNICINIVAMIHRPSVSISYLVPYFWTLVLLNSSLNPLIYCWKMRNVRHVVKNMVQNVFVCRRT